jgi:hypothetical protein
MTDDKATPDDLPNMPLDIDALVTRLHLLDSIAGLGYGAHVLITDAARTLATERDRAEAKHFLLRKTEDELHEAKLALASQKKLALAATTALAAERDRANQAEGDRDAAFAAGVAQVSRRAEEAETRADRAEARTLSLSREQVHRAVIAAGFNISARLSDGDVTSLWGALNEEITA